MESGFLINIANLLLKFHAMQLFLPELCKCKTEKLAKKKLHFAGKTERNLSGKEN